ncbi:MAG: hypothetical protein LBR23_09560 [Spirochaetaceae bacterium]|jgi:hypothetical protein|nr:hypothetical protein [Spirochaetaceae bacterium]
MKKAILLCALCSLGWGVFSQDDFGFGDFGDSSGSSGGTGSSFGGLTLSGEASAGITVFPGLYDSAADAELGDLFSGTLEFGASVSSAEALIRLNIAPVFDGSSPVTLDEAYVRGFFGPVSVEGGLRKITWGKADSEGPLDVVNPLDNSDLTVTDVMDRKIARPLVRTTVSLGDFTKVEAVFVPWFEALRYDSTGRWKPKQMSDLPGQIKDGVIAAIIAPFATNPTALAQIPDLESMGFSSMAAFNTTPPSSYSTLDYAQGGLRFTTTAGPADIGVQYYYGRLTKPAVSLKGVDAFVTDLLTKLATQQPTPTPNVSLITPVVDYNPFHQIGVDWAQVIAGFNLRAEFAAVLTSDMDGTDGSVYNPFLGWSFGFDRDIIGGINLNFQCNETIRLFDNKVNQNRALDTEAGTNASTTRITALVSKKFFKDELEVKLTTVWNLEDMDALIMPGVVWTRGDLSAELTGGAFAGDPAGELGQYRANGFLKASLTYTF